MTRNWQARTLAAVVLALGLGFVSPAAASKSPSRPVERLFHWISLPRVRVCQRADLPVERVRQAMDWWSARGVRFGELTVSECAFDAAGTPLDETASRPAYNVISVTREGQLAIGSEAGVTRWATHGDVPLWALVIMPRGSLGDLTLEHELGHALGFPHVHVPGHIMNPRASLLGESTAGLDLPLPTRATSSRR